ncbi:MAG TPA: hypothetical protein VJR89_27475, partial [Polyangiales bacterium]|nr:hypothetical protein [Polyangiales bacterium]
MGVVFEARECHSGEHVAIKLLHSRTFEALQLLKREYRMLAGLQHRNLV